MSIRRASDWFRVSGFTLTIDDYLLCLDRIEKWFEKLTVTVGEHREEVIFCPRQFVSDRKVQDCYVSLFLTEIRVFSGGTESRLLDSELKASCEAQDVRPTSPCCTAGG